nr:unnamed protein product [Spirometra erinaceieuropaei]
MKLHLDDENSICHVEPHLLKRHNRRIYQPERRTTLVARELARHKVDIAALSETWFSEQGQLKRWVSITPSERPPKGGAMRRESRFCHPERYLLCRVQDIKDRPMGLRLPLRRSYFKTIISAYVPPMSGSDKSNDKFYEDLDVHLASVPKVDKLFVHRPFCMGSSTGFSQNPNQRNCVVSQLRWINAFDGEVTDSELLDRALQKSTQPSLYNFRRHH